MVKMRNLVILLLAVTGSSVVWADVITIRYGNDIHNLPWRVGEGITFMTVIHSSSIRDSGNITKVEWEKTNATSENYTPNDRYPTLIWMGMKEGDVQLGTGFLSNYKSGSQVLLGTWTKGSPYVTPARSGWYDILLGKSMRYSYNYRYHLLIHLAKWGGNQNSPVYASRMYPNRTLEARSYRAGGGTLRSWAYNIRITIEITTGVNPTSFGRIKALYE
jgi:hypothetical protein